MSDQNIRNHGAVGDGATLCTTTIQDAINACASGGGGRVAFPAGAYVSGSLTLRDNVTLDLAPEARLLGSRSLDDYPAPPTTAIDAVGVVQGRALIRAEGCHNVGISGSGTIDGRGGIFREERPQLLRFVDCQGVALSDVTL